MVNEMVSSTRTWTRGASDTDALCDGAQPSTSTRHPGQQSKVIGAKGEEPATKVRYAPLLSLRCFVVVTTCTATIARCSSGAGDERSPAAFKR